MRLRAIYALSTVALSTLACSTAQPVKTPAEAAPAPAQPAQLDELRTVLTGIDQRMIALEAKMGSLNEKVTTTQGRLDAIMANHAATGVPVPTIGDKGIGSALETNLAANDPESGFVADQAIQAYRQAMILHAARKYPEAVLSFSTFVEKFPDHALAGSAQYFVGNSYFQQKEYKLALKEFERVLTSYDRSPRISDTLREMADAEEQLKMGERSARHRQMLMAMFPQSPAAASTLASASEPATAPAPAEAGHPAPEGGQPAAEQPAAPEEPAMPTVRTQLDAPPTAPMTAPKEAE